MDIQLPDMLGMDAAKQIRQMDETVVILFITVLSQYAIEGYSVGALDYILKPVSYPVFSVKLDRAVTLRRCADVGTELLIKTRGRSVRISSADILYIEIMGHNISLHLNGGTVLKQWGTLSQLENQLKNEYFARCHACYLVNLKYVREIRRDEVIIGETALTISQTKRREFLQAFMRYRGGSQ